MPYLIAALLSVHALSAVFWAGSTLAQVAHGGDVAPPLRGPQLAAAALAIVSGGALWANLHAGAFGTGEVILLSGAAAAICALAAQVALRTRGRTANRIAAPLLAISIVTMVVWRVL